VGRPEVDFVAVYGKGVDRLAEVVEAAAGSGGPEWDARLSAGLRAGLDLLSADPELARLLLVEAAAVSGPLRAEHEDSVARLAKALRPPPELTGGEPVSDEILRLQAGGLTSYLSGRVLAGEAEMLAEDHGALLRYLLAFSGSSD
jgi:AcrR family transcriptional regulator